MAKNKKNKVLSLNLDTISAIDTYAKKERRSLSNTVEYLVSLALEYLSTQKSNKLTK